MKEHLKAWRGWAFTRRGGWCGGNTGVWGRETGAGPGCDEVMCAWNCTVLCAGVWTPGLLRAGDV